MAPVRTKKRGSDASSSKQAASHRNTLPTSSPATPMHRSPIKQRKMKISLQQKQALIDNLQLEVTERARRLRAQYHLQAQGLRSRIEIRINRIPTSLRKVRMEDLLLKYAEQGQKRAALAARPPPVPAKDSRFASPQKPSNGSSTNQRLRAQKRSSDAISADKENEIEAGDGQKKRMRVLHGQDSAPVRPAQILSPTSSNSRLMNRERPASPAKSGIARPASPLKMGGAGRAAAATNMLSSFVEKAKSSRAAGSRKVTTTSNTSGSSAGNPAPAKTRRGAATPTASRAPATRPATRTGRRVSLQSETSEGSTGTVVRKTATTRGTAQAGRKKAADAPTKASETKKAAKTATASTTRAGRILRNRG